MKKVQFGLAGLVLLVGFTACSGGESASTTTENTTTTATDSSAGTPSTQSTNANNTTANTTTTGASMPLTASDSTFVMKAAMGGMMEVAAGNAAQQNAQSDRVKAFGAMMVSDHTNANQELMTLASRRGVKIPSALPAEMQKHVDAMQKMKGKEFDSHYMSMMLNDHKKTVTDFKTESTGGKDDELKAWAGKTLPTLQAHLDSAQAISKGKM